MVNVYLVKLVLPYYDHADVALSNLSGAHVQSLHMLTFNQLVYLQSIGQ